jgi:hypothetical protein
MRLHFITDVNKPGNYPHGGWWFVIRGIYSPVSGRRHDRKEDAEAEMELLKLIQTENGS